MWAFLFVSILIYFCVIQGRESSGSKKFHHRKSHRRSVDHDLISFEKAVERLTAFGYLSTASIDSITEVQHNSASLHNHHHLEHGINNFQRYFGLPITGKMDESTRKLLAKPRCGVADNVQNAQIQSVNTLNNEITYAFHNYSPDLSVEDIKEVMQHAFDIWSTVIPHEFKEVSSKETSDVEIKFATGAHGDSDPFDGKGHVLAHASKLTDYPVALLHFDDDEKWKRYRNSDKYSHGETDILWVALHEAGHVLGLDHNNNSKSSIMFPYYQKPFDYNDNYIETKLSTEDIAAIQRLHGPKAVDCPGIPREEHNGKNVLYFVRGQLHECCKHCKSASDCIAFSWNESEGGTCFLKRADEVPKKREKRCSAMKKNKDIFGHDIAIQLGSLQRCCDACKSNSGCRAYAWVNLYFFGGKCFLKNAVGPIVNNFMYDVSVGVIEKEDNKQDSFSKIFYNKDIVGNYIDYKRGQINDCFGHCKATQNCDAFAWSNTEGGTCWLKSAKGPVIEAYGIHIGIL